MDKINLNQIHGLDGIMGYMPGTALERSFFERPTLQVARELLGAKLIHDTGVQRVAGLIIETEAYIGEDDQACHARAGVTPRTKVMYGLAGHAYVYFNYGMHWLFNCVTEAVGFPAAVLVRALYPVEGLDVIASRRSGQPQKHWTDGPGKLCQALGINGHQHNGLDLCTPGSALYLEAGWSISDSSVTTSTRVGLNHVSEPWKSKPWRFFVAKLPEQDLLL